MVARLLAALATAALVGAAQAEARWDEPAVVERTAVARAAAAGPGDLVLFTAARDHAARLLWAPAALTPTSTPLAAFPTGSLPRAWHANARGDALMLTSGDRSVRAALAEASGSGASFSVPTAPGTDLPEVSGDVGDDGTAAVAWFAERDRDGEGESAVTVRVRAPGAEFAPAVTLPAPGPIRELDVDVAADGSIAVVHGAWDGRGRHQLTHVDLGTDSAAGPSVRVASTRAASPYLLRVIAGGPGRGRVLFEDEEADGTVFRTVTAVRTGAQTWAQQRLERRADATETSVEQLPDGGAVVAYVDRRRLLLRRAAPGQPFGAAGAAGTVPRGWSALSMALAVSPSGGLLGVWEQATREGGGSLCGDTNCHRRLVAAAAAPGGVLGPAVPVTPLGSVVAHAPVLAAVTDEGRRLVAWTGHEADAAAPEAAWAALGDAGPDVPSGGDGRAPRVRIAFTRAGLRRAVRSGRLRASIRSDERCAVRVSVYDSWQEDGVDLLRGKVVPRGTTAVTWPLTRRDRRILRVSLGRSGRPSIIGLATDSAANLRVIDAVPRARARGTRARG